jgi:hypothetical protein
MPDRQRAIGGTRVTSLPRKRIVPPSVAILPVMRLNSVDLPAPFGPMMPSAAPSPTAKEIPSANVSAPNFF